MVQVSAHNVLTKPVGTVYLNEPMNKPPQQEDKTEPQDAPESDEPTSATTVKDNEDEKYKKRYDDLKRHYDSTLTSFKSEVEDLKTQLANKTLSEKESSIKPPRTKEEFEAFKEKYPDLVSYVLTAASMVATDSNTVVLQKMKQLEESQRAINSERGIEELKKYHPDFMQIKDDPRFIEWFDMQPVEVKSLIKSPNPKVIAQGLDLFKNYAGIKPKAEVKKDATREVKTPTSRVQIGEPGKRTYTNAEIHKMPIAEFEKLEADIKAAQYDGRIVG